jgi:type VI secretion system secreted protein Hcp
MSVAHYMTIIGKKQNLITQGCSTLESIGNGYQQGREDQILVHSFDHGVYRPQGAQSGGRIHRPVTITKALDKSTPLIYNAVASGEILSLCKIDWYRVSPKGFQGHFFTTEFKDAIITSAHTVSPQFNDPAFAHITQVETVSFTYRTIVWTHEASRTVGSDYWHDGALA